MTFLQEVFHVFFPIFLLTDELRQDSAPLCYKGVTACINFAIFTGVQQADSVAE